MAHHRTSRKGAGGGRGGVRSRAGRPADSHARSTRQDDAVATSAAADPERPANPELEPDVHLAAAPGAPPAADPVVAVLAAAGSDRNGGLGHPASVHARALQSPARPLAAPVRRTAKYAVMIGVSALFFSGLGGVPPRVDAQPAQATPMTHVSATSAPSLVPAPAPAALPGVSTADEVPLGDDAAALAEVIGLPGSGTDPGTLDDDIGAPSALASPVPATVVNGAVISYRGPTTRRVVALTFDDGYNTTALKRIYSTLVANDVAATFFVNGIYLSRSPHLWQQIADAGFPVGNHTYHHADIRHLTAAQLSKELAMTASAWRKITGTELIPYFRPPYGAHSAPADALVAADGYPNIVLWSNSVADTSSATTVATGTAAALRAGPGGIVLLHVGPSLTPKLLQGVIDGFRARGFSFVTIPQLFSRSGFSQADRRATSTTAAPRQQGSPQ